VGYSPAQVRLDRSQRKNKDFWDELVKEAGPRALSKKWAAAARSWSMAASELPPLVSRLRR
jgi:hypothetical protein